MELPSREIVSFRLKKRRLGGTVSELRSVLMQGLPQGALTLQELAAMEMQCERAGPHRIRRLGEVLTESRGGHLSSPRQVRGQAGRDALDGRRD